MATAPGQGQALEALYVTLSVDDKQFLPQVDAIDKAINALEQKMVAFGNNVSAAFAGGMANVSKALGDVGKFLQSAQALQIGRLDRLSDAIKKFMASFTQVDTAGLSGTSSALSRMGGVLNRLGNISVNPSGGAAQAFQHVVSVLNTTTFGPNVNRTISTLNRFANAMQRLSPAGGGPPPVRLPTFIGGVPSGMGRIPPASARAVTAVRDVDKSFMGLSARSTSLIASMAGVRNAMISFGGLGYFAMREISMVDDAITRAMMHDTKGVMSGNAVASRPALMSAVLELSGKTRTSATELAGALDLLMSNGMSAGMAIDGLARAENFALAGGMKMEAATRRIIDVQRALGMNSTDVEEHFRNMNRLSDAFVGVAPKVGSSVDELSAAFTGRLATAMNATNMSVEEGIALMGAMSTLGPKFRGATGGEQAARLLNTMLTTDIKNAESWKRLLGTDVIAGGKTMPIADIADLLTKKLGTAGTPQRRAQLLEGMDLVPGVKSNVEMLIGLGDEIRRVQDSLAGLGGISGKAADMMRNNLTGQMMILRNNAANVAVVIGERLAPVLFTLTAPLVSAAQWFTGLKPAMQNLIVMSGLAAVSIYPLYLVLSSIVGLALSPFRMLGSLIYSIGSAAVSVFSSILSFAGEIPGMLYGVARTASSVASTVWTVFMAPFRAMLHVVTNISTWLNNIGIMFWEVGRGVTTVVLQGLIGIGSILSSIIIWTAAAIVLWPLMIAGIAGVAAVLVTVGLGIASLAGALASGVAALWAGFKAAVSGAFAWMADRTKAAQENIAGMWETFKGSAANAFKAIGDAINRVAGFLWNFRDNVRIIGEWWKVNWEAAVEDIGNVTAKILENLASNFVTVVKTMGGIAVAILSGVWTMVSRYFSIGFEWLRNEWGNIWNDAGKLFSTFIDNLVHNFMQLLPVIDAIADYIMNRIVRDAFSTDKAMAASKKRDAEAIKDQFNLMTGQDSSLRGPFEGVGELSTGTGLGFGALMRRITGGNINVVAPEMVKGMGAAMSAGMAAMKPFIGNVETKAPWQGLIDDIEKAGGFKMPEGGIAGMLNKAFTGSTKTDVTAEGAGGVLGKGGPGYGFQQTSMARFEVGGELQESLDRQQLAVMISMDKKLGAIAEANRQPGFVGPPRPVIVGGGD